MMKTLNRFAMLALTFFGMTFSLLADPNDSKDVLKENSVLELERFFFAHKRRIVSSPQWTTFVSGVKRYNLDKKAFNNMNEVERARFNESITYLKAKLSKMKHPEAAEWATRLEDASQSVNKVWSFDTRKLLPENDEAFLIDDQKPAFNLNKLLPGVEVEEVYIAEKGSFDVSRLISFSCEEEVLVNFNTARLLPALEIEEVMLSEGFDVNRLLPQGM
jgi:hypothetical protein